MHEGRCCSQLGLPGLAGHRRGADGAPRHRAVPAHRRAASTCCTSRRRAASSWCGRPRPTVCRSPPRPRRTTSRSPTSTLAGLRPGVQGQPAAAHGGRRRGRSSGASPTARSTPSPPTTRRTRAETKEQPLDQAPPGMLGLETALGVALARARHRRWPTSSPLLSWKPAAIAGVADRHGRPIEPGEPANLTVFDPDATWTVRPARARQQEPQHAVRRSRRCAARSATPCSTACGRHRRRGAAMNGHAIHAMNMQEWSAMAQRRFARAARAGRRQRVRGRAVRRDPTVASPAARSSSTPC